MMVAVDVCSATGRLSRDIASLTSAALEAPVRVTGQSPFSREVEAVRQHLRLLTDRDLLAESYSRESSVILREGTRALELDPVVLGYALRWFEVGDEVGRASRVERVACLGQ